MYDVVIIGAGPGGTSCALSLIQAGIQPLIIEKAPFPRYQIGESLTAQVREALRQLGLEPRMAAHNFPVKHGVTVYGAEGKNHFWFPLQRRDENGKSHPSPTWQVRRSVFDNLLLETALGRGAELLRGEALAPVMDGDAVQGVRVRLADGATRTLPTRMLVDASGQATFLANRSTLTSPKVRGNSSKQVAVFSQVTDTVRDAGDAAGNTFIFYRQKHHWAWFIPLSDEVVSVGVVTPTTYFKEQGLPTDAFLKQELRTLNPELSARVPNLKFVAPIRTRTEYSYYLQQFAGLGYLCIGDAHRFIDPIFSFGVHFAIHEGIFAARTIAAYLEGGEATNPSLFHDYQALAERGQNVVQDLLDCFWNYPLAFLLFAHYQYREDIIQLFSGDIYGESIDQRPGVEAIRALLGTDRQQTRTAGQEAL